MKRFLFPAAILGLVLSVTPGRGEAPAPGKPIAVPFELLKSNHMAVKVKVNGKGPYRLIFDTGAPITLINNKLAKEAGVLDKMPKPAFTVFGSMGEAKAKTFEVGDVKATNVPVIVMDHPTVKLIAQKLGPIDGLVGFPFFARYSMTVDYQAKTLTFVPNGYKPPDVMKGMMTALMAMGKQQTRVLAPAAQWGMTVSKESTDEDAGVTVKQVVAGSAAAAGGLKVGDRLLTLDGRWTDSVADTYAAAGHVKAGTTAVVKVKRGGKEIELRIAPAAGL